MSRRGNRRRSALRRRLSLNDGTIEPIRGKRIKSGDFAVMDADGGSSVTGRTKDLIIRGGSQYRAVEIDAVLLDHRTCSMLPRSACHPIYGEEVVAGALPRPAPA
jgi:acyl-coenzyme A synthetase/AMP-(fatty) acid ligase